MTTSKKILYIVNDPGFFLSHRLIIAREAARDGYEVHVATPGESATRKIIAEGFSYHEIRLIKHGINLLVELRCFLEILFLLRSLKPDVVHLVTIKPVIYGGIAARLASVPAVVSAITGLGTLFVSTKRQGWRGIVCWFAKKLYVHAFKHDNQIVIFQNPDDRKFFVNAGLVKDEKVALLKGSGVNVELFSPCSPQSDRHIVLLAGRMLWEKGVGDFVEAAKIIRQNNASARFVLAGRVDPWNRSSVSEAKVNLWQEAGLIEWWGNRDDMAEVLNQTAIACLPSYGEGVPKFLIEAAACGCPIVTTDTPGCREIVRDGVNGLLVPVRNAEELAVAIEKLLKDDDLRTLMGRAGRSLAVAEFREEIVVRKTLEMYKNLLTTCKVPLE